MIDSEDYESEERPAYDTGINRSRSSLMFLDDEEKDDDEG